jgi:hypothetical protein
LWRLNVAGLLCVVSDGSGSPITSAQAKPLVGAELGRLRLVDDGAGTLSQPRLVIAGEPDRRADPPAGEQPVQRANVEPDRANR